MGKTAKLLAVAAAALAVALTAAPATASSPAPRPAGAAVLSAAQRAMCPGNTVSWKANQPGRKWAVEWADVPSPCWVQAALLCRNTRLDPPDKWRHGQWKFVSRAWSYVKVCPSGYSACKGNVNITASATHRPYQFTTVYLWPQCRNARRAPGAHLTAERRNLVRSGTGTATISGCSRPYKWETYYYTYMGQAVPAAAVKWSGDPRGCNFWAQARVYASTGCPAMGHSGPVQRDYLWAVAHAAFGNVHLCFGAVHFKRNTRGASWTGWHRVGASSGREEVKS